jgi:RNA polymerase subunit RPABC4/transcription elongation factor Spt4
MSNSIQINAGFGNQTTEIYLKRTLSGRVEDVRHRLIAALERVGYDVIEEEPNLLARRGASGWGTWMGSADVLDYAMTLVIRLKPIGDHSTQATFDYVIKHPWLSKGEREVLTREAAAIAALAKVRTADKLCAACGTQSSDDSRFCRNCGSPMTSEHSELDVLRMTAQTRAAHTSVVTATILSLACLLFAAAGIAMIALGKGAVVGVLWWLAALSLASLLVGGFAWRRINKALNQADSAGPIRGSFQPSPALQPLRDAEALPEARTHPASVTEGTTELFEAVPIRRTQITGPMDS